MLKISRTDGKTDKTGRMKNRENHRQAIFEVKRVVNFPKLNEDVCPQIESEL